MNAIIFPPVHILRRPENFPVSLGKMLSRPGRSILKRLTQTERGGGGGDCKMRYGSRISNKDERNGKSRFLVNTGKKTTNEFYVSFKREAVSTDYLWKYPQFIFIPYSHPLRI